MTFTSADLPNSEACVKYDAWVTATDDADVSAGHQMNGSFVIKRRTEWRSFNASPEPVSKGKPIKITGALKVANWESRKYTAQEESRVSVQFEKAGTLELRHRQDGHHLVDLRHGQHLRQRHLRRPLAPGLRRQRHAWPGHEPLRLRRRALTSAEDVR